tara:strand:+ start:1259 stop:1813 length:555 start_codon:yes stop_codon:yes gene_type:complete
VEFSLTSSDQLKVEDVKNMDDLRRILVVEDEPDLREIIVSILSDNHSHVVGASNGQEGLDQLASDSFSLVLSDIKMPLVDGLEFFARAKSDGHHIPFVFITAFGDEENMLKALRLGAFDFVRKPFNEEEVRSVVERALEVGHRKRMILKELGGLDKDSKMKVDKCERMIQLLEVSNHKKRAAGE